jgi:hypothetical protein
MKHFRGGLAIRRIEELGVPSSISLANGDLSGKLSTGVKASKGNLKQCEECSILIKHGKRCKPCAEERRAQLTKEANKSFYRI